jgi:hypothetical protein
MNEHVVDEITLYVDACDPKPSFHHHAFYGDVHNVEPTVRDIVYLDTRTTKILL